MAHNKNARAAAQMLAGPCRRVHATTGASSVTTTNTTLDMHSETLRRGLRSESPATALWNRGVGIRFSPGSEAPSLYPALDFKRFFQSQEAAAAGDNCQPKTPPLQPPRETTAASTKPSPRLESTPPAKASAKPVVEKKVAVTYTSTGPIPKPGTAPQKPPPKPEPPLTSLEYKISNELFQAALGKPKDSPGSYWSHTMYKSTLPDGTTQNVKVHYCTSKHTTEHVCQKYFLGQPVLGFDLEWEPYAKREGGPRENVSLIQIASPGRIGLFHVARFVKDDFVAPTFRAIMEDAAVEKVGVHIQADCTRLRNFLGVDARGVFELSHLYKLVKHAEAKERRRLINKVPVALATQVHELLKLPLYKGQSVRSSNWSKPLNTQQLTYSAADAYAGLQLYHVLEERRLAMDPPPDRPRHAELRLPIPIPPTPEVSDAESELESDMELIDEESSSEYSDDSIEEAMEELAMAAPSYFAEQTTASTSKDPNLAREALLEAADAKVAQRRASRPDGRLFVSPSALRSFYLWHASKDLAPANVAKLLRDPPLQTGTVIGYILDAIQGEKLEFSKERLHKEVLSLLHPALASGKYRGIVKQCQQVQT